MRLVRIQNITRASVVARHAGLADTPFRRLFGMMGRTDWGRTDGLVIRPCSAIHTLFMRMSIDVLLIGPANDVLEIAPGHRPWRLGPVAWRARWVLELPTGAIADSSTRLDDRVALEDICDVDDPASTDDGGVG